MQSVLVCATIYRQWRNQRFEPGGRGQALAKGPTTRRKYEMIGRNFNDAEKSEQCSKVTRKSSENNLEVWGRSPQPTEANGGGGAKLPCDNFSATIFPAFLKK